MSTPATTYNGQPWVVPQGDCPNPQLERQAWIDANTSPVAPEGVPFKVGDFVTYTNAYGVKWPHCRVEGFTAPDKAGNCVVLRCQGDGTGDAYWCPHHPKELTPEGGFMLEGEAEQRARLLGATRKGLFYAKTGKDKRECVSVYYIGAYGLCVANYSRLMGALQVYEKPRHVSHEHFTTKERL